MYWIEMEGRERAFAEENGYGGIPSCPHCAYRGYGHRHTKRWYMKKWRINPERLGIEPEYTDNPHNPEYPMKLYRECQVREQHNLHPELTIKPRTEKQKEAIKKLVALNKRRRMGEERIERKELEETEGTMREKRSKEEQKKLEEEALERLRRRAKTRREKKFKSDHVASLDQYMN